MVEEKESLLNHYRESRAELLSAVNGLSDTLMVEPSIDGWSVKDHLAHIALWDDIRVNEIFRISAGFESTWRLSPEQESAASVIFYKLRVDLSLNQVMWEIGTSRQRLLDAISSATVRGLDGSLYGEAGLKSGHERQHAGWIKRWRAEKGI